MKKIITLLMALMLISSISFADRDMERELLSQGFVKRQGIELRNSGSGRLLTQMESTSLPGIGKFDSRCFWEVDGNQNIQSFGVYFMRATSWHPDAVASTELIGSYLVNSRTARITAKGEIRDGAIFSQNLAHIYYLYGNGSYFFDHTEWLD